MNSRVCVCVFHTYTYVCSLVHICVSHVYTFLCSRVHKYACVRRDTFVCSPVHTCVFTCAHMCVAIGHVFVFQVNACVFPQNLFGEQIVGEQIVKDFVILGQFCAFDVF